MVDGSKGAEGGAEDGVESAGLRATSPPIHELQSSWARSVRTRSRSCVRCPRWLKPNLLQIVRRNRPTWVYENSERSSRDLADDSDGAQACPPQHEPAAGAAFATGAGS
jgi:hypothetical protein